MYSQKHKHMTQIPKLNTLKHFREESPFDRHLVDDTLARVFINRDRIINDAKNYTEGKKTEGVKKFIEKYNSAKIRLGYKSETTIQYVAEEIIKGNDGFIGTFMVSPKRQHGKDVGAEYLQTTYIQNQLSEFSGVFINRLKNNGPESERIVDGKIIKGIEKSQNTTKSLDCLVDNPKDLVIRCINKVTTSLIQEINDKGGAQGNQLELSEKDVDKIDFSLQSNQNVYIIFILDGKYYKNNPYVLGLIEKYKENKHVYLTTSDGIKEVIGAILHN